MRAPLVDMSDGGCRLHLSLPVPTGTTAILLRMLPDGVELGQSAIVAWCRPAADGDGYEAGLRRIR